MSVSRTFMDLRFPDIGKSFAVFNRRGECLPGSEIEVADHGRRSHSISACNGVLRAPDCHSDDKLHFCKSEAEEAQPLPSTDTPDWPDTDSDFGDACTPRKSHAAASLRLEALRHTAPAVSGTHASDKDEILRTLPPNQFFPLDCSLLPQMPAGEAYPVLLNHTRTLMPELTKWPGSADVKTSVPGSQKQQSVILSHPCTFMPEMPKWPSSADVNLSVPDSQNHQSVILSHACTFMPEMPKWHGSADASPTAPDSQKQHNIIMPHAPDSQQPQMQQQMQIQLQQAHQQQQQLQAPSLLHQQQWQQWQQLQPQQEQQRLQQHCHDLQQQQQQQQDEMQKQHQSRQKLHQEQQNQLQALHAWQLEQLQKQLDVQQEQASHAQKDSEHHQQCPPQQHEVQFPHQLRQHKAVQQIPQQLQLLSQPKSRSVSKQSQSAKSDADDGAICSGLLSTPTAKPKQEKITTLMVRNLPRNLSQAELLYELDRTGFRGLYDFCYLPHEFNSGENQGYAFVNFASPAAAGALLGAWHRQSLFGSEASLLVVTPAALQGLEANKAKWCARRHRVRNPKFRAFIADINDEPPSKSGSSVAISPSPCESVHLAGENSWQLTSSDRPVGADPRSPIDLDMWKRSPSKSANYPTPASDWM